MSTTWAASSRPVLHFPATPGQIPQNVAPLAEMLRLNGYSTAAFGKWHETAAWEASVAGPFDRWPTRQGFDKFYGFLGGETDHWAPSIYDGVAPVKIPEDPDYHFLTDMTDQSVAWVKYQKALTPDKPFFSTMPRAQCMPRTMYPRSGSTAGRANLTRAGTNCARKFWLDRLNRLVPQGTQLAPKPEAIPDWDSCSPPMRKAPLHPPI
jgi:hypothetical protein